MKFWGIFSKSMSKSFKGRAIINFTRSIALPFRDYSMHFRFGVKPAAIYSQIRSQVSIIIFNLEV
jgi:hypothetical protein